MKRLRLSLAMTLAIAAMPTIAAEGTAAAPQATPEQQAMMEAWQRMSEVRAEHKQLASFAGHWTAKSTMWEAEGAPPSSSEAKATSSLLYDGRYVETVYEGDYQGQAFTGRSMMGFDNLAGKYFNTWVDSMSTGFWLSYGTFDHTSNTYTFTGDMRDMMKPDTMVKVRTTIRIDGPDAYTFDWYETRDGKERKTMSIAYARAKS